MKPVVTLASELLQCLAHHQFERLTPHYGPLVRQVLTNDLLAKSWNGIIAKTGKIQYVTDVNHEPPAVHFRCRCEKSDMNVFFSFDNDNLINGLRFSQQYEYKLPQYAKLDVFKEEEIEVGEGRWKLPGRITVPLAAGKHPCLILVHGSGSLDEDETIGPNKPFKDIAYGLASCGISVLRYPKRNFHYSKTLTPEETNSFTLVEECVEDPVAAISSAANHPKIDKEKIFVLGHSLGGFACPLIAQRAGNSLRGIISLAGNTRHIADMIREQMEYLMRIHGGVDQNKLDLIEMAAKAVRDPSLSEQTPKDLLLNISPKYWLFLQKYDPIVVARSLPHPMLILHASRDYQVTYKDFNSWRDIKDEGRRMTYKEYHGLNHLMMPCDPSVRDNLSTLDEYNTQGNVDEEVINDIERWIKSIPS